VRGFVFLLAKSEFYSHLASWRVVIRTPASALNTSVKKNHTHTQKYMQHKIKTYTVKSTAEYFTNERAQQSHF
jgi:hypothetical protein